MSRRPGRSPCPPRSPPRGGGDHAWAPAWRSAVIGWFLADAGAHGQTTDALRRRGRRVAGRARLGADGVRRTARHRAARPHRPDRPRRLPLRPLGRRHLGAASTTTAPSPWPPSSSPASTSSSPSSPACSSARSPPSPGLGRADPRLAARLRGRGHARDGVGTGRLSGWVDRVPGWIRSIAYGASAAFLLLVAASAVLVAVMLVARAQRGGDDDVRACTCRRVTTSMYALATVAVAPNAVLLGGAYLLGPGFAVGTGTVVSPSAGRARAGAGVPAARGTARRRAHPAVGDRASWRVPVVVGAGRRGARPAGLRRHGVRLGRAARLRQRVRRRPAHHAGDRARRRPDGHRPDGRHRRPGRARCWCPRWRR